MSKVYFDQPKLIEMQNFLDYIYTIGVQNPYFEINKDFVYRELCNYGLSSIEKDDYGNQIDCSYLFDKWKNRNDEIGSRDKNLVVKHDKNWPHFLQFYSDSDYDSLHGSRNFIKLYIPIKYKNIFNSVNVLFDYIRDSGIAHLSKVSDRIRSDNVVIRLAKDDLESAIKIIDFIKNDNTINNNLNKTNPFVPTIKGIGFMYESGITYNGEMSLLISKYIKMCLYKKIEPSISDFYKWFKGNNVDKEIDEILSYAINENSYIEDEEVEMTDKEKNRLFIDSIKATFQKYNMNQVMLALKSLLEKSDYSSFTNGNGPVKYRNELKSNVSRDEAISFIEKELPEDTEINYPSVLYYCQNIFKKEMLNDFLEACYITLYNYNRNQLRVALKRMVYDNNPEYFSRYTRDDYKHEKNYRTIVGQYNGNSIINFMKLFLDLRSINYEDDVDKIIDLFIDTLINLSYQDDNDNERKK